MKISIYLEPAGSGIGGAEFVAALLAEALAKDHQVDLFHRIPSLTIDKLVAFSGTNLQNVQLHYVDLAEQQLSRRNPLSHYKDSRNFLAELSKSYDVFVPITHGVPPFCHAKKGALILLFPTPTAPYVNPEGGLDLKLALKRPGRCLYQTWVWKKRMESYQLKTAISEFSREWGRRRWGIECEVIHPPVNTNVFREVEKQKFILSVGRFAIEGEGHTKKQEQMLDTYRRLNGERPFDWQYFCVGGLSATAAHQEFFDKLTQLAPASAHLKANIDWSELISLYERASIFWHAAGYGQDQNKQPIFVEHFGISTVEAMAAGCVPVVINKGGQAEIVEHGVNGFLWDTLDELKDYTTRLMNDDELRVKMAQAARRRAQMFSRETFVTKFVGRLLE